MNELVYWEIPSTDVKATATFFAALFGWEMTPSTDDYMMFRVEGGLSGGIQRVDEKPGHGIMAYVQVDDIPTALATVEELGGTVTQPRTDIGHGYGFWAGFEAPGGCRSVGLYENPEQAA